MVRNWSLEDSTRKNNIMSGAKKIYKRKIVISMRLAGQKAAGQAAKSLWYVPQLKYKNLKFRD